jgi:hypothetical protein
MTRIACGWCGHPTPAGRCLYCGRDPVLPWFQRGREAPVLPEHESGRPTLDERDIRRRYQEACDALVAAGREPTVEAIAERLDRSPRTIREWRAKFAL